MQKNNYSRPCLSVHLVHMFTCFLFVALIKGLICMELILNTNVLKTILPPSSCIIEKEGKIPTKQKR